MTNTKALLLAFLIVSCVIVSPVCASNIVTTGYFPDAISEYEADNLYDFTYSVNSSRAISNIQFRAPKGTELNYTITYGAGGSMSGYITYLPGDVDVFGYGEGVTTINIGSATDSRSFIDTGLLRKWEIVGYAREEADNGSVISTGYAIYDVSLGIGNIGLQSGFIAYEPVASLQPIESITFTSNQPVWLFIGTADRSEIQSGISKTALDVVNEWVQLAIGMSKAVISFLVGDPIFTGGIYWWIKFFFIDNLLLVIVMYFSVTMAYSAITSRGNVFKFYKNFIKYQKALFQFIISLWESFVVILATFRGIFRL